MHLLCLFFFTTAFRRRVAILDKVFIFFMCGGRSYTDPNTIPCCRMLWAILWYYLRLKALRVFIFSVSLFLADLIAILLPSTLTRETVRVRD